MKRKRIMIIGPRNCGKTTLANRINGDGGKLRKTQDTIYAKYTIDVPAAFVENAWMYMHIIALSQDANCVLLLIDQTRPSRVYSPGFARVFRCPVIGVITKADDCKENAEICMAQMKEIGLEGPVFSTDSVSGNGLPQLIQYLCDEGCISLHIN